jgi:hypothetical protein
VSLQELLARTRTWDLFEIFADAQLIRGVRFERLAGLQVCVLGLGVPGCCLVVPLEQHIGQTQHSATTHQSLSFCMRRDLSLPIGCVSTSSSFFRRFTLLVVAALSPILEMEAYQRTLITILNSTSLSVTLCLCLCLCLCLSIGLVETISDLSGFSCLPVFVYLRRLFLSND